MFAWCLCLVSFCFLSFSLRLFCLRSLFDAGAVENLEGFADFPISGAISSASVLLIALLEAVTSDYFRALSREEQHQASSNQERDHHPHHHPTEATRVAPSIPSNSLPMLFSSPSPSSSSSDPCLEPSSSPSFPSFQYEAVVASSASSSSSSSSEISRADMNTDECVVVSNARDSSLCPDVHPHKHSHPSSNAHAHATLVNLSQFSVRQQAIAHILECGIAVHSGSSSSDDDDDDDDDDCDCFFSLMTLLIVHTHWLDFPFLVPFSSVSDHRRCFGCYHFLSNHHQFAHRARFPSAVWRDGTRRSHRGSSRIARCVRPLPAFALLPFFLLSFLPVTLLCFAFPFLASLLLCLFFILPCLCSDGTSFPSFLLLPSLSLHVGAILLSLTFSSCFLLIDYWWCRNFFIALLALFLFLCSCSSSCSWCSCFVPATGKCRVFLMALFFSLSTPLGVVIGIFVADSYKGDEDKSKLIMGECREIVRDERAVKGTALRRREKRKFQSHSASSFSLGFCLHFGPLFFSSVSSSASSSLSFSWRFFFLLLDCFDFALCVRNFRFDCRRAAAVHVVGWLARWRGKWAVKVWVHFPLFTPTYFWTPAERWHFFLCASVSSSLASLFEFCLLITPPCSCVTASVFLSFSLLRPSVFFFFLQFSRSYLNSPEHRHHKYLMFLAMFLGMALMNVIAIWNCMSWWMDLWRNTRRRLRKCLFKTMPRQQLEQSNQSRGGREVMTRKEEQRSHLPARGRMIGKEKQREGSKMRKNKARIYLVFDCCSLSLYCLLCLLLYVSGLYSILHLNPDRFRQWKSFSSYVPCLSRIT